MRQRVAEIIERVLAGRLSASDALARAEAEAWPADDRLISNAWHALMHYQADADIRERDDGYAEWQRQDLSAHVAKLRA
jgi:hypothetical protein